MQQNPVLGTWRLISWENRSAAGAVSYPFGADAIGYITYTADEYMFVVLMRAEREPADRGRGAGNAAPPVLESRLIEDQVALRARTLQSNHRS